MFFPRNASRSVHGGNIGWVLREFPQELVACRHRHRANASTLLIVVVDADGYTVEQRRNELCQNNQMSGADPLVVLIPKRHIETWIRAALGQMVNENDNGGRLGRRQAGYSTSRSFSRREMPRPIFTPAIRPRPFFITTSLCAPSHTPNPTSATMFSDWDSAELCRSPETAPCVSNSLIITSGAKSAQQAVAKSRKIGPE